MQPILDAIAEPRRRAILQLVSDREMTAGQIAGHFDVTRPAISQHLRVLKDAGLLHERQQGRQRLYRVRPEGLAELREFMERFWDLHLEQLKHAAESEQRGASDLDADR